MSDKPIVDAVLAAPLVEVEEEPLPPIPIGLFDEIYRLATAPQCRKPGLEKPCMSTCEPGPDNVHGENLMLLPGEAEYLKNRFSQAGVPWKWGGEGSVVVPLGKECPYHEGLVCTIHDLRPFTCRSYPLRCHKIGKHSLAVFSAIGCPFKVSAPEALSANVHHRTWVGAWKALMPYLDDRWWTSFERACPAGMLHLGDILDPAEQGVPSRVVSGYADKDCEICGGAGMTETALCACISDRSSRREILRDVHQHRRRFTT